ncbi:MAG: arginase family protein [Candidatus Aenigmarchaeota archaeon]|nr:arginase family protein [Candidatus Aenigmarchaeota archaeon]
MLHTRTTFLDYNWPLKEAQVIFAGVPFVSTATNYAAPYGPVMVRSSLAVAEDYISQKNMHLFEKLRICDIGDVNCVHGSFDVTSRRIKQTIRHVKEEAKPRFWIFIGGDHSVTLPIVQGLKAKTVVVLDAHDDLNKMEVEHSHATWARHAKRNAEIYFFGTRTWGKEEEEDRKLHQLKIEDLPSLTLKRPVHLSLDIDCFSPSFIGKTGYFEGTLRPEDVHPILSSIRFSSMDVVEIADTELPSKSGFLAAEMIKRVLAFSVLGI